MTSMSRTVAIVTGGCSGLGAGAASALLQRGARVLVADLASEDRRGNLARLWAENWGVQVIDSQGSGASSVDGPAVTFMEADVCVPDQVNSALDAVERCFGEPVSCAVNCAGIALARKTLSKRGMHPLEEFQKVLSVNTVGTFNVACLAAERMSRRDPDEDGQRGVIINTASIAAFEGQKGQVAYAASKGGVVGMTLPMARDLAPNGIRVMTIVRIFEEEAFCGLSLA
jgi:3-hydroxyacyl-CoA dehydrogenase/3-hydroxy-2-methylbutyryl-CoA dehydrogenase